MGGGQSKEADFKKFYEVLSLGLSFGVFTRAFEKSRWELLGEFSYTRFLQSIEFQRNKVSLEEKGLLVGCSAGLLWDLTSKVSAGFNGGVHSLFPFSTQDESASGDLVRSRVIYSFGIVGGVVF